jgi:exopolysaccharide biosynthesis polyprenyl glycosylphosphotransferase
MSSEAIQVQPIPRLVVPRPMSRISLHLSPIERKYLLMAVDLLLVNGSLLAAVTIWNDFALSWPALLAHAKWFITLSLVWSVAGTVLDIYNLARSASTTNIMASAGLATLSGAFLYLSIPWLTPPVVTRTYALGFVLLTTLTVMAWRVLYARALVQPTIHRRALVLGAPASASELIRELQEAGRIQDANPFRGSGYQIVGLVSDRLEGTSEGADDDSDAIELPWLGDARHLTCLSRQHGVDEVILALGNGHVPSPEVHEALLDCRELGVQIVSLETVYERLTARLPAEYSQQDPNLILGPADSPTFRLYTALKRLIDILLSLLGLIGLVLIIPWVALANALCSPGPLFYRQRRIGKGGRSFVIYKFRSMIRDAEKYSGAVWCEENDPRITPVGRWLRKTRLDEVPQFINVLRGEMSVVGPRPERPCFVGRLTRTLPLYRVRNAVKPGLTGWAQLRYRYGDSVEDAWNKLEYDLYYVKHASLFLDLLILLQTPRVVLMLRGQ